MPASPFLSPRDLPVLAAALLLTASTCPARDLTAESGAAQSLEGSCAYGFATASRAETSQGSSSGKKDDSGSDKSGSQKEKDSGKEPEKQKPDKKAENDEPYHFLPPLTWGGPDGKDNRLQLGGDTRVRLEARENYGGVLRTRDDDTFLSVRTRLNADLIHRDVVRAFVEVLDGRVWWNDYEYPQEAHASLHQAFLELGKAPEFTSWSLRLGRQEIELGRDRRLMEASNWNNLRRTFDGARAMYRTKEMDADLFLVNTTSYNRMRNGRIVTERVRRRDHEYFYGGYATLRQWDPHTIEAYFLGLSNTEDEARSERDVPGTSHRYTLGSAMYGPLRTQEDGETTVGYGLEGAYQFGHHSEDRINAWMLHGDLWYEWEHPWKPRVTALGNLASGDRKAGDGVTNTFNPLFGATHSPYGIMDFVRLQNMRELGLVGRVNPAEKLQVQLEYHALWRDTDNDAWYDATGTEVGRGPGRYLGQEIDAVVSYRWSKCLETEAGAAHFFPGTADRTHGSDHSANFFYVQAVLSF